MSDKNGGLEWGKVQGAINVPAHLRAAAQAAGQVAYAEAEQQDFCGDEVAWLPDAAWHAECAALFPEEAVRQLGFEPATKSDAQFRVYSTHGTDPHVDGDGAVFVLVLANDGLKFKQGKQTHITNVGEWYIFDDCRTHTVNASRNSTSYVFLHRALEPLR
ncbi:hypothetical protein WJ97_12085 [Burkholderia ubonensis]|uniref:hypothetical protein n=1 Tax=Burkholderia ubonensis TaxID=101571 RepID=UPI00075900CA|nr:hypothetical protein [Burkholderia ubonensis]KVP96616.1 hypothetical protein WJ97_12085 [Burkholderia ubonensis]